MDSKSNEIPAVQELLEEMDISGCIIAADALNCQKKTAETVISGGADYLLSVKYNHPCLKQEIADYVEGSALRETMDTESQTGKNRDRIEKRSAIYNGRSFHGICGKCFKINLKTISQGKKILYYKLEF